MADGTIKCRNTQIFGGANYFCPNFPENKSKKNDLQKQKKTAFSFFSNQGTSTTHFGPNFTQIFPDLPEKH